MWKCSLLISIILMISLMSGCGKAASESVQTDTTAASATNQTDNKWDDIDSLQDSIWVIESEDATSIYSNLDNSFKGKEAKMYIHFDGDNSDIVFECMGKKYHFENVKISGIKGNPDGTAKLEVDAGNGEAGVISIPADAKQGSWNDISDTYIENITFADIPEISVTSENLSGELWDPKITNTKFGENVSPELKWDTVEGASNYVVIMIDGAWLHMDVFTTETSIAEGAVGKSERGNQYVGPYPPTGTHTYSVFVFALKNEMGKVTLAFDAGGNSIDQIYKGLDTDKDGNTGNVIAYGRLDGNYTHRD